MIFRRKSMKKADLRLSLQVGLSGGGGLALDPSKTLFFTGFSTVFISYWPPVWPLSNIWPQNFFRRFFCPPLVFGFPAFQVSNVANSPSSVMYRRQSEQTTTP